MEPQLLVLDLDETLVFATESALTRPADFVACGLYHVYARPHVHHFLVRCGRHFELAVWTSSSEDYAAEIVDHLFPDRAGLRFVWGRERCTLYADLERGTSHWLKDLKKIAKLGFGLERVLVVDDSPEKLRRNYGNHIAVTPYEGDPADDELLALAAYLQSLRAAGDVRTIEKRGWRKHLADP